MRIHWGFHFLHHHYCDVGGLVWVVTTHDITAVSRDCAYALMMTLHQKNCGHSHCRPRNSNLGQAVPSLFLKFLSGDAINYRHTIWFCTIYTYMKYHVRGQGNSWVYLLMKSWLLTHVAIILQLKFLILKWHFGTNWLTGLLGWAVIYKIII